MTDEETITSEQDGPDQEGAVLIDLLSGTTRPVSEVEELIQRTIHVLAEEYKFPLESMARDVPVSVEVNGRRQRKKADLVVFTPGHGYELANAERIVVVRKPGTKPSNLANGTELLKQLLDGVETCELGLWTNGRDVVYLRKRRRPVVNDYEELIDFPGMGEALDDLDRPDRRMPGRVAVAEDLRDTVLRCHDYLYGNQSMQAPRVFSEMVKLIFSKIYDERLLQGGGHTRQFWVGITERNIPEGRKAIADRVRALFARMKEDPELGSAFRPQDEIELRDAPLAWVAAELARYQFLDAELDVKGMAYEAIVASTMKRERGQFFTPLNVVRAMVEILAPEPQERVLDPACGSGRFLVACLDRFRQRAAEACGPRSRTELRRLRNSPEVIAAAAKYARKRLFGIDVDPELVRAARMYMLLNNDGHANLFELNSLAVSERDLAPGAFQGAEKLQFGSFDVVLTNPPFGSAIPVDDPELLQGYDLGHRFARDERGGWVPRAGDLQKKMPPEILFIERCLKWLKPGGRMGIVVPDGILGNPDNEPIRTWILRHTQVLASIDLPVEAFLPQVGVQASLLFLRKRSDAEVSALTGSDYPIFMAIAEQVGHDRRGVTVYRRDPDGFEVYKEQRVELEVLRDGEPRVETRAIRAREVADDLPAIAQAYCDWVERGEIPTVA